MGADVYMAIYGLVTILMALFVGGMTIARIYDIIRYELARRNKKLEEAEVDERIRAIFNEIWHENDD